MSYWFRRLVASGTMLCLLGTAAPGASPASAPSPGVDVTRATLDNGLRVVIVRDPLAPVVTVYDNYLVGANETPAGFPGMAHAQEHMVFRGCSGVSGDQISAIYAQLGGDGDADTQQTITQYFSTVPAADVSVALRVDSACMRDVEDSEGEWKQERGAIEQEVARDLSSPTYTAYTRLAADLFAGTPYEHDPLGTRPSFQATTGKALKDFYTSWYAPNNAVLVIAGDVDPQPLLAQIRELYGSIPRRAIPARPAVTLQPVKSESFTLDSDLPYALTYLAYRFPGSSSPDYAAAQILADVLGSQRGAIYGLSAAGKALGSGAVFGASYPAAGMLQVYGALPAGGDTNGFAATLARLVADDVKNGLPADLVEAAKRSEIASAEYERNSISGLASSWSDAIANEGRNSPDEDVDAIRKVTTQDVDRVARTYLTPTSAVTATLVPRPSGKAVPSKGFGGGETLTRPPSKPVVLPSWAAASLAQITVPPSKLSPVDTTLPNGLRLIVQPETASNTVTVLGEVKHQSALETPAGREGSSDVLEGLFSYGTTSLDRLAYQKALDDIAAQQSGGTAFSLHVLRPDFERGVALLADDELHPALPPDAFSIVKQQTADELRGQRVSPDYLTRRAISTALLPPRDPELREATPASVAALTLPELQTYFGSVYRPDMTTIVVIGNVTPAEAQTTVEKYFGSWTAQGPKPATALPPVPANAPSSAVVPNRTRVQDQTTLVETVGVTRTNPDFYALELGDHVLGGGFYATRLYHDLRQVAGLVYDVSNRLSAGTTRSTYSVSYGSDPVNVSKARALVVRDLRAMQTTNVEPHELQQAKAILLRQLPLSESSVDAVGNELLGRAVAGLPLDESHRAAEKYSVLTAAQIRAAFAKYIRPAGFVQVVEGPPPG